jgi:hypothetical protein
MHPQSGCPKNVREHSRVMRMLLERIHIPTSGVLLRLCGVILHSDAVCATQRTEKETADRS